MNPTKPKKISRRTVLQLMGAGATGALVAACAPQTTPQATAAPTSPGPVKIRYAHMNCWDEGMCNGQKQMITDFNAANPKIQVEAVEWSWGNYLATLQAAVSAGEAPDIMNVGWGEVISLGRPYFITLDSYLDDDLKNNINVASWNSSRFGDQTLGIPVFEQLNEVLYYRSDVWEKAGVTSEPQTWADYLAVAKQLQAAGITDTWGMQASGAPITSRFIETQFQNNSPLFVQNGDKWQHTLDTPESREAGQYWYDLWQGAKVISQSNLQRAGSDLEPVFAEGKMGMLNAITQTYFSLVQAHPELADTIRIAPPAKQKSGATMGGAFALSIFQQSKNKDAAWEFVKWASSAAIGNKIWIPTTKVLPTRKDVSYPQMPDHIQKRFAEYQAVQRIFPLVPQWEEIKGKVLTPGLGQMASGAVDFDTGWKNLIDQTNFVMS